VSLANTKEVLYLVNRPGNAPSHDGAGPWIDRAIALVKPHAGQVHLRGDTDFSLTGKFDEWDQAGVTFNLGMDNSPKLVVLAQVFRSASGAGWCGPKGRSRPNPGNVGERERANRA